MNKITLAMGSQFLTSYSKLSRNIQGKVLQFIQQFQLDPKSASIHYEKITEFKDSRLRSVRIDQTYRGIILDTGKQNIFLLLWVDHHDEAYKWAKNKQYSINPNTGMIQFMEIDTVINSLPSQERLLSEKKDTFLFDGFRDREFKRIGVPIILIPYIRLIENQDDLNNKLDKFSPEIAEVLAFIAAGISIEEIEREIVKQNISSEAIDTEDFKSALENSANQRSFMVLTDDSSLQKILEYPLEKWRIFLHPSQRSLVQKDYNGPIRVLGGAGTGKTVVALHRAQFLASSLLDISSNQKVLFTTFSKNLAENIKDNLRKICSDSEMKKIEVKNLDAWAREYLIQNGFKANICSDKMKNNFWDQVYNNSDLDHSLSFLKWEWKNIIQDKGISSKQEYLKISRIGSGTSLNRKERANIWKVFQDYRAELDTANLMEYDDVLKHALSLLEKENTSNIYKFVVVDEAQDFSENGFNLISKLASNNGKLDHNSLFIVGDSQQRIYGRKVILKNCGIKIQGRSRILKLNYRTTEEIGSFASQILSGEKFDDLDGNSLQELPYRSLMNGEEPIFIEAKDLQEEFNLIKDHINNIQATVSQSKGVCIVLRTNKLMDNYQGGLAALGIETKQIKLDQDIEEGQIFISTMHRVKGLEFDHIILASASKKNIPNNYVVHSAPTKIEKAEIKKQERSLLYVALTRARKSVAISWFGDLSEMVS
jgi:hypothetical protein